MKKEQKKALQGEAAKFLIDIAKYIITGVVISSILKDVSPLSWIIYISSSMIAIFLFITGLYFTKKKEE